MTLPATFIYTRGCTAHQLGNNSHYVDLDYKIANWYSRCSLKRILNVSQHSLKLNIEPRLLMKFLRIFSLFIHMYRFNSHGGSFLSQGIMIYKILNLNYNVHADAPTQV